MVGYLLQSLQRNRFGSLFLSLDNPDSDRKLTPNFLDFLSEREPVKILATVDEGDRAEGDAKNESRHCLG
ncbi:hypothetical protein V6N13_106749 [Hibiscus sabdariffa]